MVNKSNFSNNLTKKLISILEYKKIHFISKNELLDIIIKNIDSNNPNRFIKYLLFQKYLISIKKDNYIYIPVSSIDRKPVVSEFEINEFYLNSNKYYIGLINALNKYGFITQIPNKLFVFNTKYNLTKKILDFNIHYIKINKSNLFGVFKNKCPFSDIEKTIIDSLNYFKYVDSLDHLIYIFKKNKDKFDENKLIKYAKKINSIKLLKLIGIITENEKLYDYLNKLNKFRYYTKIRNTNLDLRYIKWKIKLI
ncbi:MAG: hypothetical protein PHR26_01605 [Candidatus ainarchaeum sp.]|nr:hypothetical protein [Candidatus ainarchaeum sp.]MDD3975717.1 hypothetical protein [Candidatus ainarchaeum sp.]